MITYLQKAHNCCLQAFRKSCSRVCCLALSARQHTREHDFRKAWRQQLWAFCKYVIIELVSSPAVSSGGRRTLHTTRMGPGDLGKRLVLTKGEDSWRSTLR